MKVFFYYLPLLQQFNCFHYKHMFDNTNMMTEYRRDTKKIQQTVKVLTGLSYCVESIDSDC
jgi:hypothetical protein